MLLIKKGVLRVDFYNEYEDYLESWDLLQAVIESGKQVKAVRFRNGWIEFDTNEDYETAVKWVEDGTLNRFIKL